MRKHLVDIYNFAQNNDKAVQFNGNANVLESLHTDIDNAVFEGKTLDQAIFQVSSLKKNGVSVKDLGTREEKIAYMNNIAGMIERISRALREAPLRDDVCGLVPGTVRSPAKSGVRLQQGWGGRCRQAHTPFWDLYPVHHNLVAVRHAVPNWQCAASGLRT